MSILFISDLHLEDSVPDTTTCLLEFLHGPAREAEALYILGDLFESWIGDDALSETAQQVAAAISELNSFGVPCFFMHGNRDFMIGQSFADETGVTLLSDPHVAEIHGDKALLSHGDAYCTDDVEYQGVRKMARDPAWQEMMLGKSLEERLAFAAQARAASLARGGTISEDITDVNEEAISNALSDAGVGIMLHGHTHRPAVHEITVAGHAAQRIVLGDWYEHGSVVRWDDEGPVLSSMER